MPNTVTVPDNIALHAGPYLVGIVFNWWLFGILCVQYYLYLSKTKNDRNTIKAIVHTVFILDAFQTCLMMEDAFYCMAMIDAILAFIVQLFYIWRINRLSGWKLIPGICSLGSLLACGSGIVCAVIVHITSCCGPAQVSPRQQQGVRVAIIIWLVSSAITDLTIALVTGRLLLRMAKERSSKATIKKISRIVTLTIETNAITSAVAFTIIALYFSKSIAIPRTKIYLAGGYVLGKLYSNCFMILLNQRHQYHDNTTKIYNTSEGDCSTTQVMGSQSQNVSSIRFSGER